jgi:hypothetical protein
MGTWNIGRSRPPTAYRNLVTAALASAIALVLLMPVAAGAQSGIIGGITGGITGGTAGQTARVPGGMSVSQVFARVPLLGFLITGSRETGCCA